MLYIPFIHEIKKKNNSPPVQIPLFIEEISRIPNKQEEKPENSIVIIELF
jgi:hypothetical protein